MEYLKDNPKQLWFKRKLFGWGWTPVKWQGWLTIALYVTGILLLSFTLGDTTSNLEITLRFALPIILMTAILIWICYKKGEKPKWQWGLSKSRDFPDSFYRVTVKGLFVKDGKILLFKESDNLSGKWELPGGGLNFGEDISQAIKREIEEESGLKIKNISEKPVYVWTWKFEHQRDMNWYYSLVLVYRVEFENLDFRASDECEKIEFFSKEELNNIELCHQTNGLKKFFDPKDFNQS